MSNAILTDTVICDRALTKFYFCTRDRPIYRPTDIIGRNLTFEYRPICEFKLFNDKRCPIISGTDIISRYLTSNIGISLKKNNISRSLLYTTKTLFKQLFA